MESSARPNRSRDDARRSSATGVCAGVHRRCLGRPPQAELLRCAERSRLCGPCTAGSERLISNCNPNQMSNEPQRALAERIESKISREIAAQTGLAPGGAMAFRSVDQLMEFAKVMAIAAVAIPK